MVRRLIHKLFVFYSGYYALGKSGIVLVDSLVVLSQVGKFLHRLCVGTGKRFRATSGHSWQNFHSSICT